MTEKKQQLNLFSLTIIVISLVIGMGIFKTPAIIAAKSGTPTIFFAAWIIGGIIALLGALVFAEIGTRLPVVGAYYKVFSYCYHPAVGFTINILILISNAASLAVVALIGADYVSDLLFGHASKPLFNISISILAVSLFYAVNLLGLRTSSRTQNVLMVVKIGLVLLLISSLFTNTTVEPHDYNAGAKLYTYDGTNGLLLLIVSMVAVSFTYGGYQQTINFGGEVNKGPTMTKGIVFGIIIVLFLYFAMSYTYVQVVGYDKMKNATAIGALLCEAWFGKYGGKIFDVCMFVSVLAYVNVLLMSNPRVMFAMSTDKVFPKIFAYKSPKTQALVPGLTVFALTTILITFFGKGVDDILDFSIFLDCLGFITAAAALLILRKRKFGSENVVGTFSKIIPVITVLFVMAYIIVASAVVIDNYKAALIGVGLLILFVILYFAFYHNKKNEPDEDEGEVELFLKSN
ncbi:MAG: APC family permease [Chitinophagaceae bacterium]